MNMYKASERYHGLQFHFHHKSEHTVDGKYRDLEMHTVHLADDADNEGNMFAAAMGIMFSVNDASR
jgi:carbonic anhydrase